MTWILFFFGGWGIPFTAYVVLQVLAAFRLKGRPRLVSLIPVVPMAIVVILTAMAYKQASNLWPILLIFASPVACLFVAVVWAASYRSKRATAP